MNRSISLWSSCLSTAVFALVLTGCGKEAEVTTTADGTTPPPPKTEFVQMGTGAETGVYYPVGGAIAALVNAGTNTHGIRLSHESTAGSVYNITTVMAAGMQFGLAQSDRQFQAYSGLAEWEGNAQTNLRFVCSLHPEVVTLIADAAIADLEGLRGKRVNLGDPGSGQRQNAIDVLTAIGIDPSTAISAEGIRAGEAARVFQDGRIDAFFYTVGHPNGAITEVTAGARAVRIMPLSGMDELLASKPYYRAVTIDANLYPQAVDGDRAVDSIGVMTTLLTSAEVPEAVVYEVTQAIFTGLDRLRDSHPALRTLTPSGMLAGRAVPLHPGAERYFRETGLLDEAP